MRKLLQLLLRQPLTWMGNYLAAKPDKKTVNASLTDLYNDTKSLNSSRLMILPAGSDERFIIFSDQHKGNRSWADDFQACEKNYNAALEFYNAKGFIFINLGDSEELWKFKPQDIIPANTNAFKAESAFQPDRYYKLFGNHDILWKNKLDVNILLRKDFILPLPVYEGMILRNTETKLDIFLTHGHQGDIMSDNNWLSTWIVSHLWMPVQRYLRLNINSPSKDFSLRNKHNRMMYDWSSQVKDLILVTGHTHKPVFASGKYFDHPSNQIHSDIPGPNLRPSYFNTGCCCFSDGDITGIEISDGHIRLIKWHDEEVLSKRMVLEEIDLATLMNDLK